ncbi:MULTISPECIES: hypothetical protein [spotted fever group]|uniref:Uncharacterized protein n=1 Tax=Rickettsia tamurae subsp. buchneri TaxID=1462938 RepID=A0A8E0WKD0_9RICK|nr:MULTISPECIES: hypothetical protein [spotted fever group]EER20753.1 hypothetical protein REIS_2263 [Rickettsia endosymbiont of Ixodes scapularis]KDO02144.1 hypothetical protein REISMN_08805 [Rickettsia tamurae subsp. buchneri]
MFKIEKAVSKILKSTSNIKALAVSSIKAIDKYLNPSKSERFEDASHEFIFKKKLSEFVDVKATNSCGDFGGVQKEGAIDWVAVRKLIYARFADEIGKQVVAHTKAEAVKGISEEFEGLRAQGYDFKSVANLIEQKKGVVVNDCEAGKSSNISSASLTERMKKLSISGYISRYAGDDNLRQDIEDVMHKKAYVMQELSLRVLEFPACEFKCDQLKQVDILGDH